MIVPDGFLSTAVPDSGECVEHSQVAASSYLVSTLSEVFVSHDEVSGRLSGRVASDPGNPQINAPMRRRKAADLLL